MLTLIELTLAPCLHGKVSELLNLLSGQMGIIALPQSHRSPWCFLDAEYLSNNIFKALNLFV